MLEPFLISSVPFSDDRGKLLAFPTFPLNEIVRMYAIEPANGTIIRAWQGHYHEKKWFWPISGAFEVQTIGLDSDHQPILTSRKLWLLQQAESKILEIPGGHLNGFRALSEGAKMLVFSDFDLESSKKDDIRFRLEEIPWLV